MTDQRLLSLKGVGKAYRDWGNEIRRILSWFGLPLLISNKFLKKKENFIKFLNKSGIETRPILSGNFLNQESCKLYKFKYQKKNFKISQEIEDRGFFIGLPTNDMSINTLNFLSEKLLKLKDF